jgi:hypothetical protein
MKTTTQRKDAPPPKTLQAKSYDQQDWAFMRLRFPFLPNILQCNWERLPLSLRNTERAFCESVVRDGSLVREPGMLFSAHRIFSLLLSYLALLQCMQSSRGSDNELDDGATNAGPLSSSSSALAAVYQALRQNTPSMWDDCKTAMHFSATLFVLPPYGANTANKVAPVKHSRPLFLGSRDNAVSDAFEVPRSDNATPETIGFPLMGDLTAHCVSAVAFDTLVEEEKPVDNDGSGGGEEEGRHATAAALTTTVLNLDEGRRPDQLRPIASQGLPWRLAQTSTPVLYHPLSRVAVLASPLVEREEYTADALGRLNMNHDLFAGVKAEPKGNAMVRRRIVLQYRCVNKFSEKNPYRTISYGRVSSVDMFKTFLNSRARGKEVQAYMSLLLRRCPTFSNSPTARVLDNCRASAFPDGLLTLHGVPAEPLYVHYRSRSDLRFTLSSICPPLRQSLLRAEQAACESPAKAAALVEEAETDLLTLYADAAATYVRKIYERVRHEQTSDDAAQQISLVFTLQPWDDTIPPHIAVQVFPVYHADAEVMQRVLDQERIWHDATAYQNNPHKVFSLLGSRYGRLPMAELRIHYNVAERRFHSTWNDVFEKTAAAPA